jgi:hypothetical protein
MASRVGHCFTDHLFEILPQPSNQASSPLSPTSSGSSPSSSSADFSRSPSFSWAKQSFPPHTLATSSSGSTHTRRERTESESGNGIPEDSIRNRIGARLRQHVDRKLHRGAPSRDGEGEETNNNKQSGGRGGRTTPNAFPHRSKSLSDYLERSGGRERDRLAPNPEQQFKRADTEPVDRRHAGVAKSSEALSTYDRGRRKQENSSGSSGASSGRSGDRMRSVVGSDGDFEAIEVFVDDDDEEQLDDIEDGWEEITEGSSDDYGYFEARLRTQQGTKPKSPPPKPTEVLSPRSAAAAEAKTGMAVTTTGFDQMAGEWVIDPRDLQLSDRVLGKGFFGEVKKGTLPLSPPPRVSGPHDTLTAGNVHLPSKKVGGEVRLWRQRSSIASSFGASQMNSSSTRKCACSARFTIHMSSSTHHATLFHTKRSLFHHRLLSVQSGSWACASSRKSVSDVS